MRPLISVVVPVYFNAATIARLSDRLRAAAAGRTGTSRASS